jgi:dienelactone hydrolase
LESGGWTVAEYVPVYTRRERRFRNLAKIVFLTAVVLVVFFILSLKVSIVDNDLEWEWVELENKQDEKLSALLLSPQEKPTGGAPAVIVTHDFGGHKEQLNRLSFELARHGFIVLALDMRDHGRSHGQTTYGDYHEGEPWDIVAAYNYLANEADYVDPNRIGIVGDGFGGAMGLMATNILLEQNKTVAATVAWGPPMDVTDLFNENWEEIEPYLFRRDANIDNSVYWKGADNRDNRSVILHIDSERWVASNVYIIYGQLDELMPVSQYNNLQSKAELYEVVSVGHDLSESQEVLEFTMDFLYRKLEKSPRVEFDFNYEEVETFNTLVHASSIVLVIFAFFMVYEVLVMRKSSRNYISLHSRDIKPMFTGVTLLIDIVAYVGIAWTTNYVYKNARDDMFMGILPASQFYVTIIFAGAVLIIGGMILWYIWSIWMPRDENRTEETCGNLRGIAAGSIAFLIIFINYIFGQVLLFGPNYPKDLTMLLVVVFCFGFFLGHELWMRKLIQPKVQYLLSNLFLRHRLPYQLTYLGIMFGMYALLALVMLYNVGRDHFTGDFMTVYGLFVLAIGLVVTLMYQRSKSILATVTYSTIMAPWLLNLAHHL